jgi:hypothetical protein
VPDFGDYFLCGYSKDLYFVILGSDVNEGWNDTSDCVILKEYKYYRYYFLRDLEQLNTKHFKNPSSHNEINNSQIQTPQ